MTTATKIDNDYQPITHTIAEFESAAPVKDAKVLGWICEMADIMQPDQIFWCDGSTAQWQLLTAEMVAQGSLIKLNPDIRPNSFLARSSSDDVARVEERTFICAADPEAVGPTNNWRDPDEMRQELLPFFKGAMRGRTMYVLPFAMGPIGGAITQLGLQLTDSPYAVLSMQIMARVSFEVLRHIERGANWVRTAHTVGAPLLDGAADSAWPCNSTKYICHFPDTLEVLSFGSGYGGNALLSKKCFALRLASVMGKREGWLAEHMLLIKVTNTNTGRVYNLAAAFPSACGKTNLAMLTPTIPGWKVETLGDDIAWLRQGADGRLYAINPEAGFFGVAPGTGESTNPTAISALWGNTIYTNVALTDDGDVWWEGKTDEVPAHLIDWQGQDWTPASGTPAAHPNSRFTVPVTQAPSIAPEWSEAENGVPLDAILFGGRRATNVPLVAKALSWQHGVFMGATISSEKTAAQEGLVGELRRDPFAMLPFCGYNMADYWGHWLAIGEKLGDKAPAIFQVNWFRKDADGKFLWPGFGENSRVIDWILRSLDADSESDDAKGEELPVGIVPASGELNLTGIEISDESLAELFRVDNESWLQECMLTEEFFAMFGDRVPQELRAQLQGLRERLGA
ncbi:phosphoenolpyruvate carboxykinase (GTP) [Canibacter sp. lx-72]|uniref:phosphoenolpyruvate carboxykinase (GTP) n=1 Tax=Canibacter zhuwentaonis TaxID=2837491 RepID=UPI001BDCEA9A|nr:phosphoenolpyruvate carboxykinase (GTP) [Canibacter zhuwentaonis]MBT1017653.1 phosphoenolpyruvate carboxykinase (GTP) [Canibacter zhuwentaonis]MBT1034808.1 phosphoenolpyruvate carboxykinase (GTP) [Canibacter zhuwentaonis]